MSAWNSARSVTGPDRSAEKPQRAAKVPSTARMRPSSSKPTSYSFRKSWRLPVATMSSSRSGRIFTARFHFLAASAATAAKRFGWVSFPPKPPPMRRTMMVMAFDGVPSTFATMCCTSLGCWVDEYTVTSSSSPGMAKAMWPSR